ncbi:hypothetical protein [Pseudomonas sp. 5P_3.1_Bac2]|uniref:hypothetical protein n=1 Tax=Pseudomonas sp. 5P_3.1_Bac2 TaxID=2971617 RepID=UPI0021C84B90|nr:hypothetical protein [Pseudomonas sp. 5P_3.1_Bac2]MCU1716159.1 hypothetical protein [Pseudomonas sp. 5P_3.1_Bac2]
MAVEILAPQRRSQGVLAVVGRLHGRLKTVAGVVQAARLPNTGQSGAASLGLLDKALLPVAKLQHLPPLNGHELMVAQGKTQANYQKCSWS